MQLFTGDEMTVLQILEISQESNRDGVLFQCSYRTCNFIETGPHHGYFCENCSTFSEQIFFMQYLKTTASEFIDNSHSSCLLFPALIAYRDKREGGGRGRGRGRVDQFRILCRNISWPAIHYKRQNQPPKLSDFQF